MRKLNVLLGDDHQLILNGLSDLLSKISAVESVDCANSANDLLEATKLKEYDIVFLDIHFGSSDGRDLARQLLAVQPGLVLAALTSFDDQETIQTVVNSGFKAFFLKSDDLNEIAEWIEKASFETVYLSSQTRFNYSNKLLLNDSKSKSQIQLSAREKQVLKLIMAEYTTKKIAEELFLSDKTIENYRSSLMLKLEVTNLTGLIKKTLLLGLLHGD